MLNIILSECKEGERVKNRKNLFVTGLLICMVLMLSLTGCETKEPEPEPYTKMIQNINDEDLTLAKKYADLVIQDFPDTDYVYNAYLIKNMILCSELKLQGAKCSFLSTGADNLSTSLLEQNDIDILVKYLEDTLDEIDELNKPFNKTLKYLLEHYDEDAKKIELKFPEQAEGNLFHAENDLQSLSFFSEVGYPIPTESDMYNDDDENTIKIFRYLRNGDDGNEAFSCLRYFYIAATVCTADDLIEEACNQIIKMTEDDKYNEYRLNAEEYLKENK